MPRKTELLNQALGESRTLLNKGDTSGAHLLCMLTEADAQIAILDRLTEIEKHLAALAAPFYEALKDGQPISLENVKPNTLGVKTKES